MEFILGLLIFSFTLTSVSIVPFINFLYKIRFQRQRQKTTDAFGKHTPIFDKFHHAKAGTPVGGGFLTIVIVTLLFAAFFPLLKFMGIYITHNHPLTEEINIIFFTFISYGLLGLYDDLLKLFHIDEHRFFGMRLRHKFAIQWILALIVSSLIYVNLEIDILNIPFLGVFDLNALFIPLAATIIVGFTNAINITDGLDGLAGGVLMIALFALWFLASSSLDTPLTVFIALWLGSLIAFLYFNIYPARIFLGDVGALSFGATLAVVGILSGKIMAVIVISGIFMLELLSSFIQLLSKKYRGKKAFPVAPFHLWLQLVGWEEPKVVTRMWLAAIMLSVFGLWLAVI
jgi:phospho-N-acetylmuramoyl-pentapeptide-transferase